MDRGSVGSVRGNTLVAVALGGGVGAAIRYELALRFAAATPPAFPTVTLLINVVGSFLLGGLMILIVDHWPPTRYVRPFIAIGILGGFTTFSTFVVETDRLIGAGHAEAAAAYVAISLVAGLVAVGAGALIADRAWSWRARSQRADDAG